MKNKILVALFLSVVPAAAQVQKVDISKELSSVGVADLYQATAKKTGALSPLAKLKDFEIHLKWNECISLAPQVFATHKEVRGWVAQTWLLCLAQGQKKKVDVPAVEKALHTIGLHKDLFQEGPWAADLRTRWVDLRLEHTKTGPELEALLEETFKLNREQKAKVYQTLGDIAFTKNQYAEAQFLFEEAQDQKDSSYLQEKLSFLAKTRGEVVKVKVVTDIPEAGGEELKLEERARQQLKLNNTGAALKDILVVLNQYAGSRAAKRLKEKPLEIYNGTSDKLAKVKALDEMREADATRLLEWAQSLHRRGDFAGALVLAKRAIETAPMSAQVVNALWIAGRSAHFTGQYQKALDFYKTLYTHHGGSDEAAEALFRASLIHYRKNDFSSAVVLLEKVLLQGKDRYDLTGQYWLVRSLQETNPERAKQLAQQLIEKYPFSYYGLRLKAESQEGKLTWPEVKEKVTLKPAPIYLVGSQKKSWQRFKQLSAAGWLAEAQSEIADFPFLKDPAVKIILAEKLVQRQQYMVAIRLINEALEADPNLRQEEFVKLSYPAAFVSLYNAEGERYGIHSSLLRALTRQESAFNIRAVSTSNALGLMQMIPPTAQEVARKLGLKIELPGDMFRPEVNIPMGSFYVDQMLGQFKNNVPFALAAYNAGPHRVNTWVEASPELQELVSQASGAPRDEVWFDELPWTETSFYVKAILRNVLLYRLAEEGSFTVKPVLWQDLLNKKAK